MSNLSIHVYPDPILALKSEDVAEFDKNLSDLIQDMIDIMNKKKGIGLAAPQVGVSKKIIIFRTVGEETEMARHLINPEIIEASGSVIVEEGCLSLPKTYAKVKRYKKIKVRGFDRHKREIILETDKFWGVIIQHEIDHLNGKLFIDRLNLLKKKMVLSKFKKENKE